ncbi:ATP-binding protein [Dyella choica]|uniref:Tetratricopeptide repeat protein n=1 Tax=Dyella choica TaxID=1927959 RepID=A0A432M9J4_9GAMM|nr:winged helix-turn-helix domain-containing protein [Dyella choica]RUL78855.1 tetratricopeptide repeat protein [Dyella choica]
MESVSNEPLSGSAARILFGPFCLVPRKRLLLRDGAPVDIGGRALDLLIALVQRPGRVISKRELLKRVWPDIIVEEGSLRFHMAGLRKILGDGENGDRYVSTQVGVGYAFVAPTEALPVEEGAGGWTPMAAMVPKRPSGACSLPLRTKLIGRDADARLLVACLSEPKLFTIVGTGGVGKTSLAIDVGHRIAGAGETTVRFVDLAQVEDAALVPYALAGALGIAVQTDDPMFVLLAHIAGQALLLIIDNCEHLIDAVSGIVEQIREHAPRVCVLATSREPLRALGEHVHWLGSLDFPRELDGLSAQQLLQYPAIELFIRRATAGNASLKLEEREVSLVADMCQRLEGIALPIELAALRVAAHGVAATHALLGEGLSLGWSGRRTALPRQQTLRATLDWSYGLLSTTERLSFDRLSAFVGPFSLDAAAHVVADAKLDPLTAIVTLDGLVAKGLVSLDQAEPGAYRLLEMTRAYSKEKLRERGEEEMRQTAFRHAAFYLKLLSNLGESPEEVFEHASRLTRQLGNVRTALEWSFGPTGDAGVAVPLAAASAQLYLQYSLMVECRNWCERATAWLDERHLATAIELELQAAMGLVLMFTRGNTEAAGMALKRALDIAVALGDHWSQLRILGRLQIYDERIGDYSTSTVWAQQALEVGQAIGQPEAIAVASSLVGVTHLLVGNQAAACKELETALRNSLPSERSRTIYYGFDHRNRSFIALARALWLRGYPDQARRWVEQAHKEAKALDHPVTRCIALIWSLNVYTWTGDLDKAHANVALLAQLAQSNLFRPYMAAIQGFKGVIAIEEGCPNEAVQWLGESLANLKSLRYELLTTSFEVSLAEGLTLSGRNAEALTLVNTTIEHCKQGGDIFALPELLRLKASATGSLGAHGDVVESLLQEALALSERQDSRAWSLRAAIDLAKLWLKQGRTSEAVALAQSYRKSVTEGFDTKDVRTLEALLTSIAAVALDSA